MRAVGLRKNKIWSLKWKQTLKKALAERLLSKGNFFQIFMQSYPKSHHMWSLEKQRHRVFTTCLSPRADKPFFSSCPPHGTCGGGLSTGSLAHLVRCRSVPDLFFFMLCPGWPPVQFLNHDGLAPQYLRWLHSRVPIRERAVCCCGKGIETELCQRNTLPPFACQWILYRSAFILQGEKKKCLKLYLLGYYCNVG